MKRGLQTLCRVPSDIKGHAPPPTQLFWNNSNLKMKWNYYIGCHSACFQFICLSLESEGTYVDANIHILLPSGITLLSQWDNATPPQLFSWWIWKKLLSYIWVNTPKVSNKGCMYEGVDSLHFLYSLSLCCSVSNLQQVYKEAYQCPKIENV